MRTTAFIVVGLLVMLASLGVDSDLPTSVGIILIAYGAGLPLMEEHYASLRTLHRRRLDPAHDGA